MKKTCFNGLNNSSAWLCLCLLVLAASTSLALRACPDHCNSVGNCNPVTGSCECPFGYEGVGCDRFVLDACKWHRGRLITGHYQKDVYGRPGPWSAWQAQLPLTRGDGHTYKGRRYQGPRSCLCLQALFKHLRMDGKSFNMLCLNVTHTDLRALIKEGNAHSSLKLHYVSTTMPDDILPATEKDQAKWMPPGSILPLSQCPSQCNFNGWCGYETASGRGTSYTFESEGPATAVVTCHCFADLGANRGARKDCSAAGESPETWGCPLRCNFRGTCHGGFCKCQDGYWGLDCGLTTDRAGQPVVWNQNASLPVMDFRPWPRVYIIDLPVQYRTKLWSNSYFLPHLAVSPYRVADASKADFFWALHTTYVGEPLMMAMFRWWRDSFPFWHRSVRANFPTLIVSQMWDAGCDSGFFSRPAGDRSAPWRTPDIAPNSPGRMWMGLFVNTRLDGIAVGDADDCEICFQPGKDLLIPPHQPMVDAPGQSYPKRFLKRYSPWSPTAAGLPRNLTFFFGGALSSRKDMPDNGRGHLLDLHGPRKDPSWVIINSQGLLRQEGLLKRKFFGIEKGMSSSQFCFVPYGTVGGYGGRYLPAVLFGCIPVIWQQSAKLRTAHPFEELPDVNWAGCSLTTQEDDIADLDKRLANLTSVQVASMQTCLSSLWPRMLYTSWHGSYIGEHGNRDAWNGILEVLARRLANLSVAQRQTLYGSGATHAHIPR